MQDKETGIWNALQPLLARSRKNLSRAEALSFYLDIEQQIKTSSSEPLLLLRRSYEEFTLCLGLTCTTSESSAFAASLAGWPLISGALDCLQRLHPHLSLVALVDLAFVGCFIAGVYQLRFMTQADCTRWSGNGFLVAIGSFQVSGPAELVTDKNCAMLKASFALGIMNTIFFFFTFVSCASANRLESKSVLTGSSSLRCSSESTTSQRRPWS